MITTILWILLGSLLLLVVCAALFLPIVKFIYSYGEAKDDWYSSFDDEAVD